MHARQHGFEYVDRDGVVVAFRSELGRRHTPDTQGVGPVREVARTNRCVVWWAESALAG